MSGWLLKTVLSRLAYRNPGTAKLSSKGHLAMAKGQKRSSREIRKPKQEKAPPKPESTFGNQIKLAENASAPRGKGKN
jgi:hypothetical protein